VAVYRCVFHGAVIGRVVGIKMLSCPSEAAAKEQVRGLFTRFRAARSVELWRSRKLVGMVASPSPQGRATSRPAMDLIYPVGRA
jgi:hypothetical protein